MFFRPATFSERFKRIFNPDEWMVKLLKLSAIKDKSAQPGTVIVQIDGLSYEEFTRAVSRHEMPHVAGLLKKEGYAQYMHYSGQPSCTPAVQGTLFYGAKSCVPAFSFRDKKTKKVFNMFSPENAREIERRIKNTDTPLLKGGSSYGNIFTGGAKEAHFCVSAIGWGTLLSAANPVVIVVFVLMHLDVLIKAAVLIAVEFTMALFDSLRGFLSGKNLIDEIKYIPFRVMACVILRSITGVGAKIDITRGMPVIHLNLAGYDEQAHHRGPKSKFAHWALRAIDRVVGMLWKAAKKSSHRDYDVIIYSDHGQEETVSYTKEFGRPVQEAINEVLKEERLIAEFESSAGYRRSDLMRNIPMKRLRAKMEEKDKSRRSVITALGPVGHIYPLKKINQRQKERISRMLVAFARIPLVLISKNKKQAIAWNAEGRFILPRDAAKVLGSGHPFLKDTAEDLVKLCANANAGEIVISGLRKQGKSITFYQERGSHGGPDQRETAGFAMLPPDIRQKDKKTINTIELREAIFASLKRDHKNRNNVLKISAMPKGVINLKIMSYNVHSCRGKDGLIRPDRIGRVIAMHDPDIVALQEIDSHDTYHQAKVIAKMLSMNFYYHSSVLLKTGLHGNAILSKFDMRLIKRGSLPSLMNAPFLEKRGALWVEINVRGQRVQVINTHLSLFPLEGILQAKNLLGRDWLKSPACRGPVILCGDFNSLTNSRICKALGKDFQSVYFHEPDFRRLKTFPSIFPLGLVDHIFLGKGIKAVKTETPKTHLEKTASDHLPLIAEVVIKVERGKRRAEVKSKT